MTTLPQPGDYTATGLPRDNYDLFTVWLFRAQNSHLQPAAYRNDFTVKLCRLLIEQGERRLGVTGSALLAAMPAMTYGIIRRRFGDEIADTVRELNRHLVTRNAYLNQASPAVQKIVLGQLMGAMEHLQKQGDSQLAAFTNAATPFATAGERPTLGILPSPHSFLLAADNTQGTTGNDRLENTYTDAALSYKAYYQSFLEQVLGLGILSPGDQRNVARQLQAPPPPPRFENTRLLDDAVVRHAYAQIVMDPRVRPAQLIEAVRIAEIISSSGDSAPALVAASLLESAIGGLGRVDEEFLTDIVGGETVDIIRDNRSAIQENVSLPAAPTCLQQMSLARAILSLKEAYTLTEELQAILDKPEAPQDPRKRKAFLADNITPLYMMMRDLDETLMPQLDSLNSPGLAKALRAHQEIVMLQMERLSDSIDGGTPRGHLQPQPQRRPPEF